MGIYNVHAGHNYKTTGANGYLNETKENRVVKEKVIELMRKEGHTVYDCTDEAGGTQRENLANIVAKCNAHTVDLDISIHFNAFNKTANGVEVYMYSNNVKDVAQRVCDRIAALGFDNRGPKINTSLYVLKNTKSKAILVECCFCDNKQDADRYSSNPDAMAKAIVEGILNKTISNTTSTIIGELYRVRLTWDDVKSQLGAYKELDNAKNNCPEGYSVFDSKGNVIYSNIKVTEPVVEQLYRIRKTWEDAKSQLGAYKSLDSAKKNCAVGYSVFDSNGNVVYTNTQSTPVEENTELYRVRLTWDDAKSQLGAYKELDNAKNNCPEGYSVFDSNGNVVYTKPLPKVDEVPVPEEPKVEEPTPEEVPAEPVVDELYRVRLTWDDAKSQLGAYKSLDNAKKNCKVGYSVFDSNGNVVYSTVTTPTPTPEVEPEEPKVEEPVIPEVTPEVKPEEPKVDEAPVDTTPESKRLYRVRLIWDDVKSQLGAYKSLENAIQSCKVGYTVYDWNGIAIYKNNSPEAVDISPLKGLSINAFIEYVGTLAREDMQKTGILASITVAQAILESDKGQSELSLKANNLFGMKASLSGNTWASEWDGKTYAKRTAEEYVTGEITYILADFRAYDDPAKSIKDHSDYLCGAMNGKKLRYAGLKGETDYKKAIQIIKNGGYATDSKYVSKIINLIEKYNLDVWDTVEPETEIPEVKPEEVPVVPEVKPEEPNVEEPVVPEVTPEVKPEEPKVEDIPEVKPEEPKVEEPAVPEDEEIPVEPEIPEVKPEEIPEPTPEIKPEVVPEEPEIDHEDTTNTTEDIKNIASILSSFVQIFIKIAEVIMSIFKK